MPVPLLSLIMCQGTHIQTAWAPPNILVSNSLNDSLIVFKPQGSRLMTCCSHVIKLCPSALKTYPRLMTQTWKGNLLSGYRYATIMKWSELFFRFACFFFLAYLWCPQYWSQLNIYQWYHNFRIIQVHGIIDPQAPVCTSTGREHMTAAPCTVNSRQYPWSPTVSRPWPVACSFISYCHCPGHPCY